MDGIVVELVASHAVSVDGTRLLDVRHLPETGHSIEDPRQLGVVLPPLYIVDMPLQQLEIVHLGLLNHLLVLQLDKVRREENDVGGQDSNAVAVDLKSSNS